MFNIGGAELLVILLVALLVLGPNKLPQAARQVGHFLGEFRRIADGFQQDLKSAMDAESPTSSKQPAGADKAKSPGGPTDQSTIIDTTATDQDEDEFDVEDEGVVSVADDPEAPTDEGDEA